MLKLLSMNIRPRWEFSILYYKYNRAREIQLNKELEWFQTHSLFSMFVKSVSVLEVHLYHFLRFHVGVVS